MGQEISQTRFTPADFKNFSARLHQNLKALRQILVREDFGKAAPTLGAELEYYLVDAEGRPLLENRAVKRRCADPNVTLELNRYNLEYNFPVYGFDQQPFRRLADDMLATQLKLDAAAAPSGGGVVAIGILPSLMETDLGPRVMTSEPRYQVLSDTLINMRGGEFHLDIEGEDALSLSRQDITAEGVCTSFQVHFCCDIADFVPIWNAITLTTPLVLALAANSPLWLGKRLWHETRVPLFKQSTDGRRKDTPWHDLARVSLANDWLRASAYELFAQRVYLYPPLIPQCHAEDPLDVLTRGELPGLHELNMHNGTIWHWNRPIYSHEGNGHIRIEMRSLPAGPSAVDMAANAAFHIGLAVGLRDQIDRLLPAIPFRFAAENFVAAARDGINARLVWPSLSQNRLWDKPVRVLAQSLVDTALQGLVELGVEVSEAERLMSVIAQRIERGQNGATWQRDNHAALVKHMTGTEALRAVTLAYRENTLANRPVSRWQQLSP